MLSAVSHSPVRRQEHQILLVARPPAEGLERKAGKQHARCREEHARSGHVEHLLVPKAADMTKRKWAAADPQRTRRVGVSAAGSRRAHAPCACTRAGTICLCAGGVPWPRGAATRHSIRGTITSTQRAHRVGLDAEIPARPRRKEAVQQVGLAHGARREEDGHSQPQSLPGRGGWGWASDACGCE
eukprot:scaffold45696_cov27-Tisochrysis_lutea.AAC.3